MMTEDTPLCQSQTDDNADDTQPLMSVKANQSPPTLWNNRPSHSPTHAQTGDKVDPTQDDKSPPTLRTNQPSHSPTKTIDRAHPTQDEKPSGKHLPPPTHTDNTPATWIEYSRRPPDGGYGWVIVAASFLHLFIVGAHFSCFSLLYPAITEGFGAEYGVSGWIGSLSQSMVYLPAFLYSSLLSRCGCRVTAGVGAVTACVGYVTSAFCQNVTLMYLTYGVIAGTGVGMMFLPSIVIVQQYFSSRRALAAGLSLTGLSIGPIVMSTPVQYCITTYGWRGTLFILGGVCLNGLVCAGLYQPIRVQKTLRTDSGTRTTRKHKSESGITEIQAGVSKPEHAHTISLGNRFRSQSEKVRTDSKHNMSGEHQLLLKTDPEFSQNESYSTFTKNVSDKKGSSKPKSMLSEVFDFSICREVHLILYGLASFGFNIGMVSFNMHTPSRALTFGVSPRQVAWLPMVVGVGNTAARLVFSFLSNLPCTNRTLQYAAGMFFGGLMILTSTLCDTFLSIALCCAAVGFCDGTALTVQPVVLVDLFRVERLAKSQAMLNLFIGTSTLLATPFSGFLYDVTGVYNAPFLVTGSVQVLAAVIAMVIALLQRRGIMY